VRGRENSASNLVQSRPISSNLVQSRPVSSSLVQSRLAAHAARLAREHALEDGVHLARCTPRAGGGWHANHNMYMSGRGAFSRERTGRGGAQGRPRVRERRIGRKRVLSPVICVRCVANTPTDWFSASTDADAHVFGTYAPPSPSLPSSSSPPAAAPPASPSAPPGRTTSPPSAAADGPPPPSEVPPASAPPRAAPPASPAAPSFCLVASRFCRFSSSSADSLRR